LRYLVGEIAHPFASWVGTTFKVELVAMELAVNESNRMWHGDDLPSVVTDRPSVIAGTSRLMAVTGPPAWAKPPCCAWHATPPRPPAAA